VIWHSVAEEDLTEAYLSICRDSAEMAERMLEAVGDALEFLRENPQAGRSRGLRSVPDIRSWSPRGFPGHLIFYRSVGDDIEVVRFLHGARDLPWILDGDG
jgi:toxin ParE1/3/4